ncbi:MAG: energy transducer TonB, partial [Cytophagales bacterium]|nr:energy transducer TonB [Armatimonadota bacterium]
RGAGSGAIAPLADTEAQPLVSPPAAFPANLLYEAAYAFADVEVSVSADAAATYKIVTGSGSKAVDQLILDSFDGWQWKPAARVGKSVASKFVLRLNLDQGLTPPGVSPSLTSLTKPDLSGVYPALSSAPEGTVRFWVTEEGRPSLVRIGRSTGIEAADKALMTAVLRSRFKPALQNGKPIPAPMEQAFGGKTP